MQNEGETFKLKKGVLSKKLTLSKSAGYADLPRVAGGSSCSGFHVHCTPPYFPTSQRNIYPFSCLAAMLVYMEVRGHEDLLRSHIPYFEVLTPTTGPLRLN